MINVTRHSTTTGWMHEIQVEGYFHLAGGVMLQIDGRWYGVPFGSRCPWLGLTINDCLVWDNVSYDGNGIVDTVVVLFEYDATPDLNAPPTRYRVPLPTAG